MYPFNFFAVIRQKEPVATDKKEKLYSKCPAKANDNLNMSKGIFGK